MLKRLVWVFIIAGALLAAFIPVNFYLLESTRHVPELFRDASNRNFVAIIVQQSLTIFDIAITVVTLLVVVQLLKVLPTSLASKDDFKQLHPSVPVRYLEPDTDAVSTMDTLKEQEDNNNVK